MTVSRSVPASATAWTPSLVGRLLIAAARFAATVIASAPDAVAVALRPLPLRVAVHVSVAWKGVRIVSVSAVGWVAVTADSVALFEPASMLRVTVNAPPVAWVAISRRPLWMIVNAPPAASWVARAPATAVGSVAAEATVNEAETTPVGPAGSSARFQVSPTRTAPARVNTAVCCALPKVSRVESSRNWNSLAVERVTISCVESSGFATAVKSGDPEVVIADAIADAVLPVPVARSVPGADAS